MWQALLTQLLGAQHSTSNGRYEVVQFSCVVLRVCWNCVCARLLRHMLGSAYVVMWLTWRGVRVAWRVVSHTSQTVLFSHIGAGAAAARASVSRKNYTAAQHSASSRVP